MRVFLSEHCTCGADPQASKGPLFAEGAAMLRALAADAARIEGVEVVVAWAKGLEPFGAEGVEVVTVPASPSPLGGAFEGLFTTLSAECDGTLHVAPETDDLLATAAERCIAAGGNWLGCSPNLIRLCGDKLRFADWASANQVPTPNARPFDPETFAPDERPNVPGDYEHRTGAVVKPRFGAGCDRVRVLRTPADVAAVADLYATGEAIAQPFLPGAATSAAALFRPERRGGVPSEELLPTGFQHVDSAGGGLAYRGGVVGRGCDGGPFATARRRAVGSLAVAGLRGWVGFDFVGGSLIEVNPRLTTSYLGYRALTDDNLAERIIFPERAFPPLRWKPGTVRFTKRGDVEVTPESRDRQGAQRR